MSKAFPITRQGQHNIDKAAALVSAKAKRINIRQEAIDANVTDKKYTLYSRNKPIMNWNTVGILRKWMFELENQGLGTFIHYNEEGINSYQEKTA